MITPAQRRWVLTAVLLGWMGAGVEMSLMIAGVPFKRGGVGAAIDVLTNEIKN